MKVAFYTPSITDYKATRQKLGLNQLDFWARVGITQSGGSRFESGRTPMQPVQIAVDLAYGTRKSALKALAAMRHTTVDELIGNAVRKDGV